jgi:DNA repair protein RadC
VPKNQRIIDRPLADRPREKLQRKGQAALSDFELLEVMIGSGTMQADVGTIARQLHKLLQNGTQALTFEALTRIRGISTAHAARMLASLELSTRHLVQDVTPLRTQEDIVARLDGIRTKQQEYCITLTLDGGQRLIAQRTITIGILDTVLAHPREIYADAIADRAATVVVAHNHPSGDVKPSNKDVTLTQQLAAAGQLLGVPMHDHLIVTKTEVFSFRQHHLL